MSLTYTDLWTPEDSNIKVVNHNLNVPEIEVEITNADTGELVVVRQVEPLNANQVRLTAIDSPDVNYSILVKKIII